MRAAEPNLVLSDVAMPGKDGYELCRDVKQDIQLCHIPVILVTAKVTAESQVEGLNVGADTYVTKPFDPNTVSEIADKCGFSSQSHFSTVFKKQFGTSPSEYK